jgi:hypothetical protein
MTSPHAHRRRAHGLRYRVCLLCCDVQEMPPNERAVDALIAASKTRARGVAFERMNLRI